MSGRPSSAAAAATVRSACDRCHAKKVRCLNNSDGTKCDRCVEQGTECVFSPAGRNGRPPRPQSPGHRRQSTTTTTATETRPLLSKEPSDANPNPDNHADITTSSLSHNENPLMPQALVNEELAESSAPHDPFWGSFDPSSLLAEEGLFDHVNVIDPELAGPPVGNDVNMFSIIGEGGSTHDAAMDDRPSLGFETNNHSGDQTQLDISSTTRQETTNQGTPSGDEMLRMLHTAQQRLREQRAQHGLHRHTTTSTTGRSVDIGIFFQMIEFAHETIRRSLPKFCNNDGNMTCDITAGLAFAATLNSVVEVYELIVAWDSSSPSPSSYTSGSRPSSSDGWNSSRTRPQSNLNSSDSDISDNSAIRPASEPQQRFQVRIGTFFPSEAVSRRILADVLVTEVHTSSKMIDRLRQHIFQSQSSATASALLSVQPGEGSNSSSSSLASLNDTFSSEMQWTLIQLLNQLQTRIARIEQHTRGARH